MVFLCRMQKTFVMFIWCKQFQERPGMLFCQLLLNSPVNLDGPQYNTSTLFYLSLDRFVFVLMNTIIEQFYSLPLYLQKDQLSVTSGLLPNHL